MKMASIHAISFPRLLLPVHDSIEQNQAREEGVTVPLKKMGK
jgi:hypothetical protein